VRCEGAGRREHPEAAVDLGADLSDKAAQTPEGLKKLVESEVARWNKVLAAAGATATER
jgi:hypothetical protein